MGTNIVEFLKTRKFWTPIIGLLQTVVVWLGPNLLGMDIPPEVLAFITVALWGIAGLVVHGDIKYDWTNAEASTVTVSVEEAQTVAVDGSSRG